MANGMPKWYFMVQYFEATMRDDINAQANFQETKDGFLEKFHPIVDANQPTRAKENFGYAQLIDLIYIRTGEISQADFELEDPENPYANLDMLRSTAHNFCGIVEPTRQSIAGQKEEIGEIIANIFYAENDPNSNPDRIKGPFRWHAVCIEEEPQWRIIAFDNGGNGGDG